MDPVMVSSFVDEYSKIAGLDLLAKTIAKPTLGRNVKTLAGVTKVKLPGQGWSTVPSHMAKRWK